MDTGPGIEGVRFVPAPPDVRPWAAGAVTVNLPPAVARSVFPASVAGMLVVRFEGRSRGDHGGWLPAATLHGPSATPTQFSQQGPVRACGLLLAPQAVMLVAGLSNRWAASGEAVDLNAVQAGWGDRLQDRLAAAPSDLARCDLLFTWLRAVIAARPAVTERARVSGRLVPLLAQGLDAACAELGLGARQLERRCLDGLGMSPRRAHAVLRMQAVLRSALREPPGQTGADLAVAHDYCDQSHMGRDMRRLAGAPLGRIVVASRQPKPGDDFWAFNVGRQQVRHSG